MKIRDRIKELRRVPARELLPNAQNWRTHPAKQKTALSEILADVGYADALIARELPDGRLVLIDGHLRAETTPEMDVPVLVLDVTEDESRKLLATIDPLAAMAQSDEDALKGLLESIETDNDGLKEFFEDVGRRDQEMKELLERIEAEGEAVTEALDVHAGADVEEPETPGLPLVAKTKRGDIYQLGPHRLMCGDSSSAEDLDALLAGAQIHLVNTDPPYNVNVEPRSNNAIAAGQNTKGFHHQGLDLARDPTKAFPTGPMRARDRALKNDFLKPEEFDILLRKWFGNLARVLLPGRSFYIWGGYGNWKNYPAAIAEQGLYFSQGIIWDKEHPVLTRKDFMGSFECCFYGWREGAAHYFAPGINNARDLWHVKKVNPQNMVHLTEKPVKLAALAMEYSSRPGENVLDLFGGSGSTLIAGQQMGRSCYLMEIDELYCDVIVERYERFTGKKAELVAG
jgi:DNA modification methylase